MHPFLFRGRRVTQNSIFCEHLSPREVDAVNEGLVTLAVDTVREQTTCATESRLPGEERIDNSAYPLGNYLS